MGLPIDIWAAAFAFPSQASEKLETLVVSSRNLGVCRCLRLYTWTTGGLGVVARRSLGLDQRRDMKGLGARSRRCLWLYVNYRGSRSSPDGCLSRLLLGLDQRQDVDLRALEGRGRGEQEREREPEHEQGKTSLPFQIKVVLHWVDARATPCVSESVSGGVRERGLASVSRRVSGSQREHDGP